MKYVAIFLVFFCYNLSNTLAKCVIPAKAGIQYKIVSAVGGFLLFASCG